MLRFKTPERLLCDGLSRRDLMKVSGLSVLSGLTLPRPGQAADSNIPKPSGPAKSVILFNLLGGPSQLDMFDMQYEAAMFKQQLFVLLFVAFVFFPLK